MSKGLVSNFGPKPGHGRSKSLPRTAAGGFLIALAALITLSACSDSDSGDGSTKVNGSVHMAAGRPPVAATTVNGSIHIDQLIQLTHDVPRIVIGPGATVQGEMRFEREVQLYVSDKATVGKVTGATPISFTGDSPPN